MLLLPAIDLRGGQCVRLKQGDYSQETVFGADPAEMARRWVDQGATFLHIVDLDGAKDGQPTNSDSIQAIIQAAGVPCQLGGGIRTEEHIQLALSWGLERVVIGTKALADPEWFEKVVRKYPQQIVLGIDAKNGNVATEGWLDVSTCPAMELARRYEDWPLAALVYTDISKDGMLQGPNLSAMKEMSEAVKLPVIASGGVTTLEDIRQLSQLPLAGCIVGRALYEGRIQLAEAIGAAM